jgi:uncharacterized alkaline shock family protein YloU
MTYWETTEEVFWILYSEPYRYGVLAVFALLILLVVIHRMIKARRPISLYRAEGGNVEIARLTLRGLIVGAANRVRGVDHAICHYDQRGRKLRVDVAIHLAGDARLKEVEDDLKKKIRRALEEQIGYEPNDVQPINVRVTKIVGEPAPEVEDDFHREGDTLPRYHEPEEDAADERPKSFDRD